MATLLILPVNGVAQFIESGMRKTSPKLSENELGMSQVTVDSFVWFPQLYNRITANYSCCSNGDSELEMT